MPKVIVIGAGLAGSLLAIYLARRGFDVDIYEARGDMRREEVAAGRSINLALSDRGIAALKEVGMDEYMLAEAVPMYGRMIHSVDGSTKLLKYSGREGEYINSISRAGLNIALMNEAEKKKSVKFHFNKKCIDLDCITGDAVFENGERQRGDTLVAADGAGSAVRQAMERELAGFEVASVFLDHGYKELHIPPPRVAKSSNPVAIAPGSDLEPNALHIWPRHKFMMIALPNFDGSFTCTLFLSHKAEPPASAGGRESAGSNVDFISGAAPPSNAGGSAREYAFGQMTDEKSLLEFFEKEFHDAVPLMPTLVEDFFYNPTGNLGTIKCRPWNVGGKALLLGDSAHAVVPFYGQGMNCAFEDIRVLDELIAKQSSSEVNFPQFSERSSTADWKSIFEQFVELRKINTDAIADMAEENFYEMRDAVADPVFVRKRELETRLEHEFPDYFSKYSMVTFREDLPYSVAKEKGNAQDKLLMEICAKIDNVSELDLNMVFRKLNALG